MTTNVRDLRKWKTEGKKFTMLTAYDYTTARDHLADRKRAHRVANLDAGPIGAGVGNPSARRWVAGKIVILNEEFALRN